MGNFRIVIASSGTKWRRETRKEKNIFYRRRSRRYTYNKLASTRWLAF